MISISLVGLLGACEKLDVFDLDKEKHIVTVVGDEQSIDAIGMSCIYCLAGERLVLLDNKKFKFTPGICYEILSGKPHRFCIGDFVYRHRANFPILDDYRIQEAIKKQRSILKKEGTLRRF